MVLLYLLLIAAFQSTEPYLLILGTAQDAGYPQINCQKELCMRVRKNPELKRYVTSLAIIDPKSREFWIIDVTPDITEQLQMIQNHTSHKGIPNGIFLTHAHIGHYTGLMYFGREVMSSNNLPVYIMPRMKQFLETNGPWNQLVQLNNIKLNEIQNRIPVQLNSRISIEAFLVPHRDEYSETVGYRITGPKKSAIFIPDIDKWSKWDQSIIEEIKASDLAFLDGSFYDQDELPGRDMSEIPHPFVIESMNLLGNLSTQEKSKVHFIHFNHSNYLLDENSAQSKQVKKSGFNLSQQSAKYEL
ncbi:MAG: pyrroloquinoline quinone biosynthesis protein PqqB [Calditrichaeota bacterium]|nr:pyrroloquinoline quinone biosynthesis protein PqqB [Calditrichota bacterium]